jgi:hypothetical protein
MILKKNLLVLFILTATFFSCAFGAYAADPTMPVDTVPAIMTPTTEDGVITTTEGEGNTITTGTPETGIVTRTYDNQGNVISTTTVSPTGITTTTTATSLNGVIGSWDNFGEFKLLQAN